MIAPRSTSARKAEVVYCLGLTAVTVPAHDGGEIARTLLRICSLRNAVLDPMSPILRDRRRQPGQSPPHSHRCMAACPVAARTASRFLRSARSDRYGPACHIGNVAAETFCAPFHKAFPRKRPHYRGCAVRRSVISRLGRGDPDGVPGSDGWPRAGGRPWMSGRLGWSRWLACSLVMAPSSSRSDHRAACRTGPDMTGRSQGGRHHPRPGAS
jgi:hypothetical protein